VNYKTLDAALASCSCLAKSNPAAQGRDSLASQPRRQFLAGLAAAGAACLLSGHPSLLEAHALAQAPAAKPRRIDTHHHFTPPAWVAALQQAGLKSGREKWSVDASLETMERGGVEMAVISPGPFLYRLGDKFYDVMAHLSRDANEFGAKMVADHPRRYSLFAQLPLPDTDLTLKEIEYSSDKLKAVGFAVNTNYGENYIGDPVFAPVLEELNRRKAIVFSHPYPFKIGNHSFDQEELTTHNIRSVLGLTGEGGGDEEKDEERGKNGIDLKYPNITFLFSHAGGTMPMVIQRIVRREPAQNLDKAAAPNSVLGRIRRFYCDTSQAYNSAAMGALKNVMTASHILFGTDQLNAASEDNPKHTVEGLESCGVFDATELQAIYRGNALRLFPQFDKT
jgi:predicted TIM-barrel fold metal-dependent hydrolase